MDPTNAVAAAETRRAELEALANQSERECDGARDELGAAVAAGDDVAAERARRRLAVAEQQNGDALAALPVADANVEAARSAADAAGRAAACRRADGLIRDRLSAAARVDAALSELGAALTEHEQHGVALTAALREAGRETAAQMLDRRSGAAIQRAVWHASPELARALGLTKPTVASHICALHPAERATLAHEGVPA